jgi:tripartite-type tricarboxylate transporter receptor subunit TctC
MKRRNFAQATGLVLVGGLPMATPAFAEAWPQRRITWVVPYSAGGASDTLTRVVGQKLGERLGQTVIIENKPGAGGNIGTDAVAKAAPDGYTWVLGNIGPMAVNPTLYKDVPYDPQADFTPISLLMAYGNVLLVNPDFQVKTFPELLKYAKTHDVPYAGNGVGTSLHLTGAMLAQRAGIRMIHVPYKGAPPGLNDTMAGVVPMAIATMASALPLVKGGKLRALAVTSPQRAPQLPDVPTVAEQGLPGFQVTGWVGLLVPKGTPAPIVERLVAEVDSVMQLPAVRQLIDKMGSYVPPLGPGYFAKFIRSETKRWHDVIKTANIKVD